MNKFDDWYNKNHESFRSSLIALRMAFEAGQKAVKGGVRA